VDQASQERFIADDLDVMRNARPLRNAIDQAGNVHYVADCFQLFVPANSSTSVIMSNGARRFGEIHHPRVDPPVGIEGKILSSEVLCSFVIGRVIEQNGAQDGPFGFYVGRQPARDVDVDSGRLRSFTPAGDLV
jgi:hypothetical protein